MDVIFGKRKEPNNFSGETHALTDLIDRHSKNKNNYFQLQGASPRDDSEQYGNIELVNSGGIAERERANSYNSDEENMLQNQPSIN